MPRLDSSAITKVTYNKKTKKMNVRFAGSGKNYTYINVPKDVYNDFINADSAGRFFNDYIKNDFEFTASHLGSVFFGSTPQFRQSAILTNW